MNFATFHPAHGALAGLAVYAITGKPLPAIVVGGSLYAYMSIYGHTLPGAPATTVDTVEVPLMLDTTYRPISHDPRYPTTQAMLVPLGYTS
jgi:TRAP-type uncharacterized transport system substrate-binding protein